MKTDTYTKILLTVIALCLSFNVLRDIKIIPNVYADSSQSSSVLPNTPSLNLLKANEDGSLNVRLMSSDIIKVEPASGARFTVEPSYSAEFKVKTSSNVMEVKPAYGACFTIEPSSNARFSVEPTSSAKFEVENSQYRPLYVKQTGSSTSNYEVLTSSSTFAYPNPANSKITISYNTFSTNEYMTICSMDGKVMDYLLLDPSMNELVVDLSRYTPGIYIYNFNGNGGKFVVKK